MAALREDSIDIPFISSEGFSEGVALGAIYEFDSATVITITPDTGALGFGEGTPAYDIRQEVYPARGALALAGQPAVVHETHDRLTVRFDIIERDGTPLHVTFDIDSIGSVPDPLHVLFDILATNATPLHVTFDILPPGTNRRFSSDIQGPVARVVLT